MKGIVSSGTLNLREAANKEAKVLEVLKQNTKITILAPEGDEWYKVENKGKTGFVAKKYIRVAFANNDMLKTIKMEPDTLLEVNADKAKNKVVTFWNLYGNLIKAMAEIMEVEPQVAMAIFLTESGGKGFDNGKMLIRFENHLFYRYWGEKNLDEFNKYFFGTTFKDHKFRETPEAEWQASHPAKNQQEVEWKAFEIARKLSETDAINSISMGLPQILGSHYTTIGYDTPLDMFNAFNSDIRYHIIGFFDFIQANADRTTAARTKDFATFAKLYNGTGQVEYYSTAINNMFNLAKEVIK